MPGSPHVGSCRIPQTGHSRLFFPGIVPFFPSIWVHLKPKSTRRTISNNVISMASPQIFPTTPSRHRKASIVLFHPSPHEPGYSNLPRVKPTPVYPQPHQSSSSFRSKESSNLPAKQGNSLLRTIMQPSRRSFSEGNSKRSQCDRGAGES